MLRILSIITNCEHEKLLMFTTARRKGALTDLRVENFIYI